MSTELLEAQLFTAVTSDTAVAAVIGTRLYPDKLPQECVMPAASYFVVSDIPASSLNGALAVALKSARVQVDVYAVTREQASSIGLEVARVIDGLSGPAPSLCGWLLNSRTFFDDTAQLFRTSMDFGVQR